MGCCGSVSGTEARSLLQRQQPEAVQDSRDLSGSSPAAASIPSRKVEVRHDAQGHSKGAMDDVHVHHIDRNGDRAGNSHVFEDTALLYHADRGILPGCTGDFEITVKRGDATMPLGIRVNVTDSMKLPVEVVYASGAIPVWNASHVVEPGKQVRVGDVILSVNGISESSEKMREEMRRADVLCLKLQRKWAQYSDRLPNGYATVVDGVPLKSHMLKAGATHENEIAHLDTEKEDAIAAWTTKVNGLGFCQCMPDCAQGS